MKYSFQGSYIVATAETLQENALLLSTQGAIQQSAPVEKVTKIKTRKGVGKKIDSAKAELLQKEIDKIPRHSTGFIPDEIASATSNLSAYVGNYLKRTRGVEYVMRKVAGGRELTVK